MSRAIVLDHLLLVLFIPEAETIVKDFNPDEYRIGCLLGWSQCILESEYDLLDRFFWGDSKILVIKNGRVLPMIDQKLRKVITVSDPRHEERYFAIPRTESFINGIIKGRVIASKLIMQAEGEAREAIIVKNNQIFLKNLKQPHILIPVKNIDNMSEAEKRFRYSQAPSLEALLLFHSILAVNVPVQTLSASLKTQVATPKAEQK